MRKTRLVIDLAAITDNLRFAQELAPESRTMPVIKADAYGHGMLPVAEALAPIAPAFAVAILEEALLLRDAGVSQPILLLEGVQDAADFHLAKQHDLTVMLHSETQLAALRHAGVPLRAWLKVDTGMHRLGLRPGDVGDVLKSLIREGLLDEPPVVCTHLASADEPGNAQTAMQIGTFNEVTRDLGVATSIANSAGILEWPDSHATWNRPGYMLYGDTPFRTATAAALRPAMRFEAEIIAIRHIGTGERVGYGGRWQAQRPSVIATIAAGYGDGYPRHAPDGTPVLINGERAPLAGAVSMDMITIDLTDHTGAAVGDTVELWGDGLPIREVAEAVETIGYELMTRVSMRVPRVYRRDAG